MWQYNYTNELYHHGIKGQKWGVRRFQNKDGTLTSAGQKRQQMIDLKQAYKTARKQYSKSYSDAYDYSQNHAFSVNYTKYGKEKNRELWDKVSEDRDSAREYQAKYRQAKKEYHQTDEYKERRNKALTAAAVVAAAYGGYKLNTVINDTVRNNYVELSKQYYTKYQDTHLNSQEFMSRSDTAKLYGHIDSSRKLREAAEGMANASQSYKALHDRAYTRSKKKNYTTREKINVLSDKFIK